MWTVELATITGLGTILGYVPAEQTRLTRRLRGPSSVSLSADAEDANVAAAEVAQIAVVLREDGVLRFKGKIDDPLDDTPTRVGIVALSPLGWLRDRRVQDDATRVFTARDGGLAIGDRLAAQAARGAIRTRIGTVQTSAPVTLTLEPGREELQSIYDIADAAACHLVELPLDGVAEVWSEIHVRYPGSGTDRPGAKFEFGEGTFDNLSDFTRTRYRPRNRVTARGAEGVAPAVAADAPSQVAYDLLEHDIAYSNVAEAAVLQAYATADLAPAPRNVYAITAVEAGEGIGGSDAPRLHHDFEVGDTCRLTLVGGRVNDVNVSVRILEATIAIGDDAETTRLEQIVLETV